MKITCKCGALIETDDKNLYSNGFIFSAFLAEHGKCNKIPPVDLSLLTRFRATSFGSIDRFDKGDLVYFKDVQKLLGVDEK